MSKTNSVIQVNGHRYDALTGQLLNAGHKVKAHSTASKKRVIDGFVIGAHNAKSRISPKNVSKASTKTPAHNLHQRPQRSKTLVRTGVKKPSPKTSAPSQPPHHNAIKVNPIRELRAKTIVKHSAVKRFGNFSAKPTLSLNGVAKPRLNTKAATSEVMPAHRMPSMVTSVSHQKLEKLLDEALLRADAHKQMMNQRQKDRAGLGRLVSLPRWLRYGLVGLIFIVVVGALVWRNLPAVAVHVAAARAGVHASVPSYTPAGFAYSDIKYAPGAITMQYKAKDQPEQSFVLMQQASTWNSATLEANALPKEGNVQTSEVKGTTVYIYGENNDATWVNNKTLYRLKNKANLTSDQVLKIVQSL